MLLLCEVLGSSLFFFPSSCLKHLPVFFRQVQKFVIFLVPYGKKAEQGTHTWCGVTHGKVEHIHVIFVLAMLCKYLTYPSSSQHSSEANYRQAFCGTQRERPVCIFTSCCSVWVLARYATINKVQFKYWPLSCSYFHRQNCQ